MTSHYVDLRARPDPESGPSQILGILYDRLHLALVQHSIETIGVSFPDYSTQPRSLGTVLRLHGDETVLSGLLGTEWMKGVRDHIQHSPILAAPENALHRTVHRRQFKTNVDRLRRRRMKRKGETEQQAAAAIPEAVERQPHLPYLHLRSRSTGQPFCLFIALGELSQAPVPGPYNSHGLSQTTTVPWF